MRTNRNSDHRPTGIGQSVLALSCILFLLSGVNFTATAARTVTDMAGREVTFEKPVTRIISSFKPATVCLFSLELQGYLVGIDNSSKRDRLNLAVYPETAEITAVGSKSSGLNFETIVSLSPQLVILYLQKDGLVLADRLEKIGIKSIVILPESYCSIKETLTLIAEAVGEPQRATKAITAIDQMLTLVDNRISSLQPDERKTAYFASPRGIFSTATGNMLQDEIFTHAGVNNVAHDLRGYFQDVSPEQFLSWNPDIVILSQRLGKHDLEGFNNPALHLVQAILDQAIYRCPSDISPWDFPSPLSVLASLWIAGKAYPHLFTQAEIKQEINRFHKQLFNKTLDDIGGNLNDHVYEAR